MIRLATFFVVLSFGFCAVITIDKNIFNLNNDIRADEVNLRYLVPEVLGQYKLEERDLNTDLEDFLNVIDLEAIIAVVLRYLEDPEVVNLITFVLGPEFKAMVFEFETIPEFKEAVLFLASKGYDPTPIINIIHGILSLPPFQTSRIPTEGVTGLIEDIINNLPIDKLKRLFQEKLVTSPEFAELYETLTSEEFENILDRMTKNETFAKTKMRLEDMGFDFEYIGELISELF